LQRSRSVAIYDFVLVVITSVIIFLYIICIYLSTVMCGSAVGEVLLLVACAHNCLKMFVTMQHYRKISRNFQNREVVALESW